MKPAITVVLLTVLFSAGCSTDRMDSRQARARFMDNSIVVQNAKRSYQLGHNLPDGTAVTWDDIRSCLPAHWRPVCLEAGYIQPGKLGEPMKCSVHGEEKKPRHDHNMF